MLDGLLSSPEHRYVSVAVLRRSGTTTQTSESGEECVGSSIESVSGGSTEKK
jgi:hypothetical protein